VAFTIQPALRHEENSRTSPDRRQADQVAVPNHIGSDDRGEPKFHVASLITSFCIFGGRKTVAKWGKASAFIRMPSRREHLATACAGDRDNGLETEAMAGIKQI